MLSIIDDAALAFEFFLYFFFFGVGNGTLLIALAPQYSPHTSKVDLRVRVCLFHMLCVR